MVVCNSVSEHVLVVSMDNDINGVIFVIRFLQVLDECIVRLKACLLALFFVEVDDVTFDEFSEVCSFLLLLTLHILLLRLLHHLLLLVLHLHLYIHLLLINFDHFCKL